MTDNTNDDSFNANFEDLEKALEESMAEDAARSTPSEAVAAPATPKEKPKAASRQAGKPRTKHKKKTPRQASPSIKFKKDDEGGVRRRLDHLSLMEFLHAERMKKALTGYADGETHLREFWADMVAATQGNFAPAPHMRDALHQLASKIHVPSTPGKFGSITAFSFIKDPAKTIAVTAEETVYTGELDKFGPAEADAMILLELSRADIAEKIAKGQKIHFTLDNEVSTEHNALLVEALTRYAAAYNIKISVQTYQLPASAHKTELAEEENDINKAKEAYEAYAKTSPLPLNKERPEIFKSENKNSLLAAVIGADKRLQDAALWIIQNGKASQTALKKQFKFSAGDAKAVLEKLEEKGVIEQNGQQKGAVKSSYKLLIDKEATPASLDNDKSFVVAAAIRGIDMTDFERKMEKGEAVDRVALWQQVERLSDSFSFAAAEKDMLEAKKGAARARGNNLSDLDKMLNLVEEDKTESQTGKPLAAGDAATDWTIDQSDAEADDQTDWNRENIPHVGDKGQGKAPPSP